MSTSKKVELKNHSTTGETPFRVAMANGEYVKQIDIDIVDYKHMGYNSTYNGNTTYYGIGWDSPGVIFTDTQVNGHVGKRTIWKYDEYDTRTLTDYGVWPLSFISDSGGFSGWYGDDYTVTRSNLNRNDYKVCHRTYTASEGFYDLPTPTFKITAENNQTSNLSEIISLPLNTDISYNNWSNLTNSSLCCAEHPITIFKKPHIPDVKMYVTSSTTPNMFYPENKSEYVLLKQGTVYASIGITDDVSNPIGVFTRIDTRTQSQGTLFYIRVLLYSPDWDSLSDMYIDWSVTGGKASNFNKTSGRITNFQWFNGGADWANYAVGYEPIYISQSSSTGVTTTTNIVANGLVFDSGIQTRDVIIEY